ncbi:MAG: shikimate kinase [Bacteroidales bacterium]|jgi:shikimate kinase|nr:shikimate kinase [Bacteroidales bacterium]
MRIYLVGYMASGKSNLGRDLAGMLDFRFIDLDLLFEERFRIAISDFFEKYGEAQFRLLERKLLHETAALDDAVIATGGGTPCFSDNMDFINQSGISLYLHWEFPVLMDRLKKARKKRPVLKAILMEDREEAVRRHLDQRMVFYRQARIAIEGSRLNIADLADRIKALRMNC